MGINTRNEEPVKLEKKKKYQIYFERSNDKQAYPKISGETYKRLLHERLMPSPHQEISMKPATLNHYHKWEKVKIYLDPT